MRTVTEAERANSAWLRRQHEERDRRAAVYPALVEHIKRAAKTTHQSYHNDHGNWTDCDRSLCVAAAHVLDSVNASDTRETGADRQSVESQSPHTARP